MIRSFDATALIDINGDNRISNYLQEYLCRYLEIPKGAAAIVFANGGDAIIHAAMYAILQGKKVRYGDLNYRYATSLISKLGSQTAEVETVWHLDVGERAIPDAMSDPALDVFYLTDPDNRLGLKVESQSLFRFTERQERTLFVVDESYAGYSLAPSFAVTAGLDRLLVIRSFSKFFGLESLRIGYAIGHADIIGQIREFLPRYPVASPVVELLLRRLSEFDAAAMQEQRERIIEAKDRIYEACQDSKVRYARSNTDFVTVISPDESTLSALLSHCQTSKKFWLRGEQCWRLSVRGSTFEIR